MGCMPYQYPTSVFNTRQNYDKMDENAGIKMTGYVSLTILCSPELIRVLTCCSTIFGPSYPFCGQYFSILKGTDFMDSVCHQSAMTIRTLTFYIFIV